MKKFYKIFLFSMLFLFLSTFNSKEIDFVSKKKTGLFKIKNIEIRNNLLLSKKELKKKLKDVYDKNIFLIKENDIKGPLKNINFLERIKVKKKYPNTVIISVYETEPIAIFFKGETKFLIDSSSNLILYDDDFKSHNLPHVFGDQAEKNFINFINKLKKNNFPVKKIKNFYYFKIDRWDTELKNNQIIKFPHTNIDLAIRKSIELFDRKDFENYNIIDLRLDGKIIVE